MENKVLMNDAIFLEKGFLISTDSSLLDVNMIYNFLENDSYWAKGIPLEKLQKAIENSICFGLYHHQKQIGFARVITDKSTFAYLADVFILQDFRKQGLSKWLMQTILNYPELKTLRRWMLATADAQGLYSKFGFETLPQPERFMQIFSPYKK